MMMEISLDFDFGEEESAQRRERIKEAETRKQAATETMEQAWERVFSSKLNDADREKLLEVKAAMESGVLERDPSDLVSRTGRPKRFSKAEALRLWQKLEDARREERIRELVTKTPANYKLIQTEEQFTQLLADLRSEECLALDTETTGVDTYRDRLVGVSLTLPRKDYHVYIPVGHDTNEPQLPIGTVLRGLRPILEDETIGKVLHNAKFDFHLLNSYGIRVRGLRWDTMVAHHLLNENESTYRLKDLATKYLKEPADTFDRLFGKTPFNEIELDVALAYAAKDTDVTWRLYQFQLYHMRKQPKLLKLYEKLENPLIDVVLDMEATGFIFDKKYAKKLEVQLREEVTELEEQLRAHFGDLNFNSPAQLTDKFYGQLKLHKHLPPNTERRTDVKTLKHLAPHHPGIQCLLDYRDKTKLLSTYIEALPELMSPDGLIHANFNQSGTVTGRFSSNNPNLQNQPSRIRSLFVAPKDRLLLTADFSQQEPRLLAHFTREPLLVEAYRAGKDLYQTAAAELFGLPESECGDGSKYRKMLKTGILACMYGTGPKTLAGQLGISEKEAEDFIAQFYAKYTKVKEWVDGNVRFARRHGYVEMLGGRKRRLPGIKSKDRWERLRAERQCTNAIIQGSAAIQTKCVMLRLDELCKQKDGWELALTVHDELGVYVPKSITIEEVMEFESVMLNTVKLAVPSKTDIEIQERWSNAVSFDRNKKAWTKTFKARNGEKVNIGLFTNAVEALAAYERLKTS